MRRFHMNDGHWHHETIDELIAQVRRNANRQREHRDKVTPLSRVTKGGSVNR